MRLHTALAAILVLACGLTEPETPEPIEFTKMLGSWRFEVQPNPDCPGGADIGTVFVNLVGTEDDVLFRGGGLSPGAGSVWSHGATPLRGTVGGLIDLDLPGKALLSLHAGQPTVPPSMPRRVATLEGTIDQDFRFTGTLSDPVLTDIQTLPIFSSDSCIYSAEGSHPALGN